MPAVNDPSLQVVYRAIQDLIPDPLNGAIFLPLEGEEFEELVASIRDDGFINPISITSDMTIIAGEQRYRAAIQAGLTRVPTIMLKAANREAIDLLRIQENLRRRTLRPSEMARAYRRLTEIRNMAPAHRARGKERNDAPEAPFTSVRDIANEAGVGQRTFQRFNRLADLIPEFMDLLDEGKLGSHAGEMLAQLATEEQRSLLSVLANGATVDIGDVVEQISSADAKRLRDQTAKVRDLEQEVQRLEATTTRTGQRASTAENALEEAQRARASLEAMVDDLQARLDQRYQERERFEKSNVVHRAIDHMSKAIVIDPAEYTSTIGGIEAIRDFLESDLAVIEQIVPWLRTYANGLRTRLGAPQQGLRRVGGD
jgi:ParB family chromosome partitioning protein